MPRCCTDEEKMLGLPNVQLNKYETAPNFIQLTQNLTLDCLFFGMQFCIRMAKKDFQHYCHSHSAAIKTLPTLTK